MSKDSAVPTPWFTPDGSELWGVQDSCVEKWEIIKESGSNTMKLQSLGKTIGQLGALPWWSSCGYKVTDDGWILSPTQKRLLWLPHRWRSSAKSRTWSGRFLGLWHRELPEVIILEFFN